MKTERWGDGKPWRGFERISAAIQKYRDAGATVVWNEIIEGRQIDVSVRFERDGRTYFMLIECRNYTTRPVSVDEVEAFVTKSKDLGADLALMVTASRFQSGAKTKAQRHGMELYTLEEIEHAWPEQHIAGGRVIPPNLPLLAYKYSDSLSEHSTTVGMDKLPIGLDNAFVPGRFYRNILGLKYRCEKIEGDDVQMFV